MTPANQMSRTPLSLVTGPRQAVEVDTTEPILPTWMRDKLTFSTTARNFAKRNAYRGGKWTLNVPAILFMLALYSPRGLGRLVGALSKYLYDWDSAQVRHQHAGNAETAEYVKAQNVRKANLKARWLVAATIAVLVLGPILAWTFPKVLSGLVGVTLAVWIIKLIPGRHIGEMVVASVAGGAAWWFLPMLLEQLPQPPAWTLWAALTGVVLALGWHGRPANRKLVKDVTLGEGIVIPVKAPMVREALCQIGIGGMKDPDQIRLLMDVHRHGPGVQVDLELPGGVAAAQVVERREKLAAALKRELGTVWPSVGRRHAAHLSLYVCDQPMVEQPQKPWRLAKGAEVDIFRPQPMFTDQRGEWVDLTFAYANMIVGAQPRMGKTFILRQGLLVTALDPRTKLYCLDGKGTGDLAPLRLVAHFYSVGDEPEEVEGRVLPAFRELRAELRRRAKLIRGLPHEEAPESKVTSALASKHRDLAPIVIGIDETQSYFGYGEKSNKAHKGIREELTAIVTDLVKRGPALGFIVLLATQNVCEETIPRQIGTNAAIRAALKLFDHTTNDQVLGTGAYSRGVDATQFDIDDKGIAYLRADGDRPMIVRSVVGLDTLEAERVAAIARDIRQTAGRLTGEAAGEVAEQEAEQVDLLADCRQVMGDLARQAMHLEELRQALTSLRTVTWGHLDNAALGTMLREAGVRVATVWVPGVGDGKGAKREWLDVAATQDVDPGDGDGGAVLVPLRRA